MISLPPTLSSTDRCFGGSGDRLGRDLFTASVHACGVCVRARRAPESGGFGAAFFIFKDCTRCGPFSFRSGRGLGDLLRVGLGGFTRGSVNIEAQHAKKKRSHYTKILMISLQEKTVESHMNEVISKLD